MDVDRSEHKKTPEQLQALLDLRRGSRATPVPSAKKPTRAKSRREWRKDDEQR